MKLAVSHPEGTPHEVDLPGKAVIGRDPGCDIVLSDSRCSRQHAIIKETEEGLVIVDTGSANGVYVNGRRTERSRLYPGDTVRLGETLLEVLPDSAATVLAVPSAWPLSVNAPAPSFSHTALACKLFATTASRLPSPFTSPNATP